MQVERQPSPWPIVVMLMILLAFCLTVPRHWDGPAAAARKPPGGEQPAIHAWQTAERPALLLPLAPPGWDQPAWRSGVNAQGPPLPPLVVSSDLLSLWPAPSIDELVAQRIGLAHRDNDRLGWPAPPTRAAGSQEAGQGDDRAALADPAFTAAMVKIGRAVSAFGAAELLPRLTVQAARAYQSWSTRSAASSDEEGLAVGSALRLVGPSDRMAALPPHGEEMPVIVPDDEISPQKPEEIDPWCVPQLLLDQLQRIAEHPHAHDWAESTLVHLHALTERNSLSGDDVRSVLASLCDSTQEAMRLAENTDNDRLRVELLRAHWALARRLDRWSVLHEIRVAAIAGERVAARGPLGTYLNSLPDHVVLPTDRLARQLETYEETRDPQLGRQIVGEKRALQASRNELDHTLADAVEQHYRNANVRVAISAEMLNRFIEQDRSEVRALRDRVGGAMVRGQSRLKSSSRVKLDPATGRWELGLESRGTIESNALADGGQARFRSRTSTDFSAQKRIIVDASGVLLQPASIDVDSRHRLMGVTTDVDWVPLFASYARDRAMREYRARQQRAKAEVESKVAAEAERTIDQETKKAVTRIENQIRQRVTDRLEKFGVKVTPVELTTTNERIVARLRIASDDQPGSHTPRPRALSDSLASAQLHESALTNAAVSLELDGQRFAASELIEHLQQKFPNIKPRPLDEEKSSTVFHFAQQDAVRFRIESGQLEVTLSLSSVEVDGRRMRDFAVHAFYVPVIDGLDTELVRDGSLGIEGRLSSGERARLHNVFNSVLTPDRRVPIVRLDDENDPRFEGLMITQLVLEDGWLGLAVGPTSHERVAERSRSMK